MTCSGTTKAPQPIASTCRNASSEFSAPERPGEAPPSAKARFWNTASCTSPGSRTTEIQSMVFFSSGVIEALYSGLAMKMPRCAARAA